MILIEAREIVFEGREGKQITKWKYTFLMPDETLKTAYTDQDDFKSLVATVSRYDDEKAHDFQFILREYQGTTKMHLLGLEEMQIKEKEIKDEKEAIKIKHR